MRQLLYLSLFFLIFFGCSISQDGIVEVVPLAPSELKATLVSSDQIDLSWKDNSTNETGYKIERKTETGNFTEIGSTAIDVTTFSDKTLSINTNYTYRVYGINQVGKSISYSNEVTIKTFNAPTLTTTTVTEITASGAKSGGTVSSDGGSGITTRGVVWGTSTNPTISLSTKTSDGTGVGVFQSAITGLDASTKYFVRAYATNSVGTGYGDELSFTTIATSAPAFNTVIGANGRIWMDRNLGASRVATSSTDTESYGDLYQWGRGTDGHQLRNSPTTTTRSSTDTPGNGNFILAPQTQFLASDWRIPQNDNLWQGKNGINNPCPNGYRLPTKEEWDAEYQSWSPKTSAGAFASSLKLPMAGYRPYINGLIENIGTYGAYWSSTIGSTTAKFLYFGSSGIGDATDNRAGGQSVRCIMDSQTMFSINCNSATNNGILTAGFPIVGVVNSLIPYTGGVGGVHYGQTVNSTGVTGLTATLVEGSFLNGSGTLTYTIRGTPSAVGVASFAINIGGKTCVLTRPVIAPSTTIGEVLSPKTGKTWMDRNLGATRVALSSTDAASYGDLYQWGRGTDGHQLRTSATTITLSSVDQPVNGSFITGSRDWRNPPKNNLWQGVNGINNPCPSGFRLPTAIELEAELNSWNPRNAEGAFASPLKLTVGGSRGFSNGSLNNVAIYGYYWSSTVSGTDARNVSFYSVSQNSNIYTNNRAFGYSVRCIKN
jgi:uncharacterized protein (TIGR02145 family)